MTPRPLSECPLPIAVVAQECPPGVEPTCLSDAHCGSGEKCCSPDGCAFRCVAGVAVGEPGDPGPPGDPVSCIMFCYLKSPNSAVVRYFRRNVGLFFIKSISYRTKSFGRQKVCHQSKFSTLLPNFCMTFILIYVTKMFVSLCSQGFVTFV